MCQNWIVISGDDVLDDELSIESHFVHVSCILVVFFADVYSLLCELQASSDAQIFKNITAYILIAAQEAYLWKSSATVTMDSPTWEISGNPLNGGYFWEVKTRNCAGSDPLFIIVWFSSGEDSLFLPSACFGWVNPISDVPKESCRESLRSGHPLRMPSSNGWLN